MAGAAGGRALVIEPPPVVTPLPPVASAKPEPRAPRPEREPASKPRHAVKATREEPAELAPAPSKDAVETKFRVVKRDYDVFKGEYGSRLDGSWNAVMHEMVFGKGDDKYERVNSLLDSLRRDMSRARTEH